MKQLTLAVKKEVTERAMEKWNSTVPCCEKCGGIHDLHYAHWPPKGMGGTKRHYDKNSVKRLCRKCHMTGDHGIREV